MIVGTRSFVGPYPPQEKEGTADWYGYPSDDDIVKWIVNLPRR